MAQGGAGLPRRSRAASQEGGCGGNVTDCASEGEEDLAMGMRGQGTAGGEMGAGHVGTGQERETTGAETGAGSAAGKHMGQSESVTTTQGGGTEQFIAVVVVASAFAFAAALFFLFSPATTSALSESQFIKNANFSEIIFNGPKSLSNAATAMGKSRTPSVRSETRMRAVQLTHSQVAG